MTQLKFRIPDDEWDAFCASLPPNVTPSQRLRELVVKGSVSPLDDVVTANEASALLDVTIRQVQRLCKSDKLTSRYADGVYLILRQSVDEYKKGSQ